MWRLSTIGNNKHIYIEAQNKLHSTPDTSLLATEEIANALAIKEGKANYMSFL